MRVCGKESIFLFFIEIDTNENWSRFKAQALTKDFSQLCVNFLFFIPE